MSARYYNNQPQTHFTETFSYTFRPINSLYHSKCKLTPT